MSIMDFKTQIEKLDGVHNWSRWKRQVELLLRHQEVDDVVTGATTLPANLATGADAAEKAKHEMKVKTFLKKDALAMLILV